MMPAQSLIIDGQSVGTIRQSGEYSIARLRPDLQDYVPQYERGEQSFAFRSVAAGWLKSRAKRATKKSWQGRGL